MAAYTKENLCFFTLILLKRMSRGLYYNALVLDNNESNVFSSPEHKVLRVSYCDRSLSVVRRRPSSVVRRASCVVRRP